MDKTAVVLGIVGLLLSAVTIAAIFYGPIAALKIQRNALPEIASCRWNDEEVLLLKSGQLWRIHLEGNGIIWAASRLEAPDWFFAGRYRAG